MEQRSSQNKIRTICGIVLSVLIAITGICLILSCLSIYRSGEAPFTRESIAAQFRRIAVPVILSLVGIVCGAILSILLPEAPVRPRAVTDEQARLNKLYAKLGKELPTATPEQSAACHREQRKRILFRVLCGTVCLLSALPLVIYLFDLSHFTPQLNESILAATYMTLPLLFLGGGAVFANGCLVRASLRRELKLLESIPKPTEQAAKTLEKSATDSQKTIDVIRIAVLAVAILLIALGIFNGGMRDVLGKAIKICTECIGLG